MSLPSPHLICGKIVFRETGPWSQKAWGPQLYITGFFFSLSCGLLHIFQTLPTGASQGWLRGPWSPFSLITPLVSLSNLMLLRTMQRAMTPVQVSPLNSQHCLQWSRLLRLQLSKIKLLTILCLPLPSLLFRWFPSSQLPRI